MHRLRHHYAYLAGPMDDPNSCRQWRPMIREFLESIGVIVLDPTDKPIHSFGEHDDDREFRKQLKLSGKYDELSLAMKPVRNVDLRMVDKADFVVANVDWDVRMSGTKEEIALANRQKKPVVVCCKQGKAEMSDWDFARLKHEMFFDTWEEVIEYILHIHTADKVEHLKRWFFFDLEEQITTNILTHSDIPTIVDAIKNLSKPRRDKLLLALNNLE